MKVQRETSVKANTACKITIKADKEKREYEGKDVTIVHLIYVDGKQVDSMSGPSLKVKVKGTVNELRSSGSIAMKGKVTGNVSCNGSFTGDAIGGNVQAGGGVTCDAVQGSVSASGSVRCDSIGGNIQAGGSVRYG